MKSSLGVLAGIVFLPQLNLVGWNIGGHSAGNTRWQVSPQERDYFVPVSLGQAESLLGFDRFCFHLFHVYF